MTNLSGLRVLVKSCVKKDTAEMRMGNVFRWIAAKGMPAIVVSAAEVFVKKNLTTKHVQTTTRKAALLPAFAVQKNPIPARRVLRMLTELV